MDWNMSSKELLTAINNGTIEAEIGKYKYWHLFALMEASKQFGNGRSSYCKIKSYIESINIKRLQMQDKIIVGFIANYASTWIGDELYWLLEKSDKFVPYVFLISNHNGQSEELIKEEYKENWNFFSKRNMRIVATYDINSGRQYTWEEIGIKPEVCIWLTPWVDLFREHFHLLNYSLDIVQTYVPYGFMIAENIRNDFVYHQYNQIMHNVAWKNFEESRIAVEMAEKYAFVGKSNAVFTGYPKMDAFFNNNDSVIWKSLLEKSGNQTAKKIIYAPHHTLEDNEPVNFSTFASNYMFMLKMAEKYQDETVWIFKPHPQLKYKAIRRGIFQNMEEWNAYEKQWKDLKNANVMEEGMYQELFLGSDAMILDSVSFLAEYLYAHKPLLFLTRKGQFFNDFGIQLMEVHYSAPGENWGAIEDFIRDKILLDTDEKQEERELFFQQNLNYAQFKGESAAINIFNQLKEGFDGRRIG